MTSKPALNLTTAMSFGNFFAPLRRPQFFYAAIASLNTISLAAIGNNETFAHTVLCRTVANTFSIGEVDNVGETRTHHRLTKNNPAMVRNLRNRGPRFLSKRLDFRIFHMTICTGCDVVLAPENDSDAHMIPKALGGRLAPRGILCRTCNTELNYVADLALIEAFGA
jgi:hypothetical protein